MPDLVYFPLQLTLGLSLRHRRILLAAYRKEGAAALAHGNQGRRPAHALREEVKDRVLELAQSRYWDSIYNGPRNLDRVICYTWERTGGSPSGEFEEAASAVF